MDGGPADPGPSQRLARVPWRILAFAALFALAATMRLQLLHADYFSDEPMSYALSRHGFDTPGNVHDIDGSPTTYYVKSWYLERPAFYLAMMPAGQISFTAYRLEYILISALLAPLAVELLRGLKVRPAFSFPVGVAIAVHPQFFVWGAITHMDTPMTVALAGAFLANLHGRHRLAGVLFVTAVWTKETAMPFLVFVFLADLGLEALRRRRVPWPLEFDGRRTAMFAGILLGFIPFLLAQEMGFGIPGERASGRAAPILDGLFLLLWIAPLVLAGLAWPRSREPALWSLALPLFYLAVHLLVEWNVREWYLVGSAFFALVAAAATLDEAWTRLRATKRPRAASVPAAAGLAILLLLAGVLLQPDSADKRAWANPLSDAPSYSIAQTLERERVRDLNGRSLLQAIRDADPERVLLIDVHYAFVQHPIPTFVDDVRNLDSNRVVGRYEDVHQLVAAAEGFAELTVVGKKETHVNRVIRQTYADCVIREDETFVLLDTRACPGRFDRLYHDLVLPTGGET